MSPSFCVFFMILTFFKNPGLSSCIMSWILGLSDCFLLVLFNCKNLMFSLYSTSQAYRGLIWLRWNTSVGVSKIAPVVKNLPANVGEVRDMGLILGWEDPLEEGTATYSNILALRIPWTEEPGRLQSIGSQIVRHDWSNLACMHAL